MSQVFTGFVPGTNPVKSPSQDQPDKKNYVYVPFSGLMIRAPRSGCLSNVHLLQLFVRLECFIFALGHLHSNRFEHGKCKCNLPKLIPKLFKNVTDLKGPSDMEVRMRGERATTDTGLEFRKLKSVSVKCKFDQIPKIMLKGECSPVGPHGMQY